MIPTLPIALERLDVHFCGYNCDCGRIVNHQKMKVYEGTQGIEEVLTRVFGEFVNERLVLTKKEDAISEALSNFGCCGYNCECGDNNITEVFEEVYEYFENSLSCDPQFLSVPKAVELNLINYDCDIYFQHSVSYCDMDEAWVYRRALFNLARNYYDNSISIQDARRIFYAYFPKKDLIEGPCDDEILIWKLIDHIKIEDMNIKNKIKIN